MNDSPKIKAGLLGAGNISEFHVRALRRLPHVEILGVADLNEARARQMAQRWKVPQAFPSLAELLKAGPDVIHVLTPPDAHAENAIEALRGGCHVFVEKPLATSVEDCDRISAAATSSGKQVCVGHCLLRDPFILRALKIVRSGAVGDVIAVDHFRSIVYPPYAGGPTPYYYTDGGYPFRDLGVHCLYLIEALLGRITDARLELGPPSKDGCPLYKEWRVLVRCERGMGQIYLSGNVQPFQDLLVVHGTRGVIRADIAGMSLTARKKGRLPGPAERIVNTFGDGLGMATQVVGNVLRVLTKRLRRYHGLQTLVGEFYEALAAGTTPPVTIDQARPIIHWTERIARQADCQKQEYLSRFATQGTAKTLLTGATGFIGRHLLKRLLKERDRVRILVRHRPAADLLHDPRVEIFLGNLGNPTDVDRAVRGVSEVFHLGATVEGWAEDFQCATVVGTQNVVNSALAHGVDKLIYMSSLSVIHAAGARNGEKIAEDWPLEPFPERRGLYSQTKLAAERIVADAVRTRGLRAIILRPGEVMGPDKVFLSGAVGREAGGRVMVLGDGKSTVPLIWVEDLIDAILAAAELGRFDGSVFNLVDREEVTQDELADFYLKAKGRRRRISHLPLAMLYPAAAGLELGLRILGRSAPLTPYRLRSAIGSRCFDCTAAARDLGWQPRVGIRRGMAAMTRRSSSKVG
jgi:predicted dehydrogenase/nucleoside-diphosphate-sugar epimerase